MKMESNGGQSFFDFNDNNIRPAADVDVRKRIYLCPRKILWQTEEDGAQVENSGALLLDRSVQISLEATNPCILRNNGKKAGVLLDFGVEIHGGIIISAWKENKGAGTKVRVRFGESAMEAMSDIGDDKNATNDHANRDIITNISSMSMTPVGETGFRFVRLDLMEEQAELVLKTVKAVLIIKDVPYRGSFQSSDELLNRIWYTGAYTVHLNMQDYKWDGIKRDRLVWVGDMHPEITTIQAVFGSDQSITRSLEFVKAETPLPGWMNGYPAYSMWWILILHDYFLHTNDLEYLKSNREYLLGLSDQLSASIDENGKDTTPQIRFLDWPSHADTVVVDAGLQALHTIAAQKLKRIFQILGEKEHELRCGEDLMRLKKYPADYKESKQAAALLVMAGLLDANTANEKLLKAGGAKGMSTFMGYYILTARAMAGDLTGCLDCVRDYWGGMLRLGATTFWEDFDVEWMEHAAPIDSLLHSPKELDIHGTFGRYCSKGYRHSRCHGWASGVTPWLTENVLGLKVLEPGCRLIEAEPKLGDLKWVKGSFPTPCGEVCIQARQDEDGTIHASVSAPDEVEIRKMPGICWE